MGASRKRDLTGFSSGRLTALRKVGSDRHKNSIWECRCSCGNIVNIRMGALTTGTQKSCGCFHSERSTVVHRRHGFAGRSQYNPEYEAFIHAKNRCTNPQNAKFKDYGGRGIQFRMVSVTELIADIGLRPSPELTLDRMNNNGHYEVGNLRWATRKEQANNRRTCKKNQKERRDEIFDGSND